MQQENTRKENNKNVLKNDFVPHKCIRKKARKISFSSQGAKNFDFEPVNQVEAVMGGRIKSRLFFT